MGVVKQLYQLQLVDSEQDQKSQRLAEVEDGLGESGDLVRAREAVAETKDELGDLRKRMRLLEADIAAVNAKLKTNQDRLYGGRVRNPKELSNLQGEAAALHRRVSELEDAELELMIAVEEDEAELAERQARERQIEATWREEQAALCSEKEQLESGLAELAGQRARLRGRIAAADLALYDDLRDRLGGVAVALLKRETCQVCGVNVPTGVALAVERGEGQHYCPTCGRLMYGGR
jgi:predicted  nucleic acid-binding Zn-ribbon protein